MAVLKNERWFVTNHGRFDAEMFSGAYRSARTLAVPKHFHKRQPCYQYVLEFV